MTTLFPRQSLTYDCLTSISASVLVVFRILHVVTPTIFQPIY